MGHGDGFFSEREILREMWRDVGFYRRSRRTWDVSSSVLGPKSLLQPSTLSIGSGRNRMTEVRRGE